MKKILRSISILFATGCLFVTNVRSQNIDINILKSINPDNPSSKVWRGASGSTYPIAFGAPVALLAYGLIKHDEKTKLNAYEAIGSLAISTAVMEGLKFSINRSRPAETYPNDVFPYKDEHGKSFPSGHTSLAFATATTLSLEYKKWYIVVPAYLWAGSVGYSRMYLGVHYPSDVLGGAIVGTGGAFLSHWLTKKLFSPQRHGDTKKPQGSEW
ncbi:MAG: phosphatase PAP2 family protein [Filimonas sp.]|nr:phosphatase PAP2 family protein [Filimonas sp.]